MDFTELKNKNAVELADLLAELKAEQRELRFKALSRQLKQVHRPAEVKRKIAQIMTLLKQVK